jgi:hypothetical protein
MVEPVLTLRYQAFRSPYKAALARAPFPERAEAYARRLLRSELSFTPGLIDGWVGSEHDDPRFMEPHNLTRDFFRFDLRAFTADAAAQVRSEVRYKILGGQFEARPDGTVVVAPLPLPDRQWVDWFLNGRRCPACDVFPDVTGEHFPCELCGYADYRDDDPGDVQRRLRSSPDDASLLAAVGAILAASRSEGDPLRRTYLRFRLSEMSRACRMAMKPLPW